MPVDSRPQLLHCRSLVTPFKGSTQAIARNHHRRVSITTRHRRPRLSTTAAIKDIAGVLIFSALPFATVQALADSGLGKKLQSDLQAKKGRLETEKEDWLKQRAQARQASPWFGPQRPKWLGPLEVGGAYPPYLQGEAPGDYGYDVLGLAKDDAAFDRNFEYELLHARWAMLSALGVLVPEVLQYSGVTSFSEVRWWNVGYTKLAGEDLNYLGVPGLRIAGGQGILIIAVCQVLLMFGPEYARACGIEALEPLGIYLPGDKNYPGGVFDPFGLAEDSESFEDLRVKEIKHGRLAMIVWLGFALQAIVTQKGPVENLLDFIQDPGRNNIFAYLSY